MNLQEEKLWGEELERRLPKITRSFTITEKAHMDILQVKSAYQGFHI